MNAPFDFADVMDIQGQGLASGSLAQDKLELMKALTSGYESAPASMFGAAALRMESLQPTLISQTFQARHARLWQIVSKKPAYSLVEEYSVFIDPGDANFFSEGGIPQEADAALKREYENVKYVGSVGKVSNPAQLMRTNVGAMASQIDARTLALIGRINKGLYFADETMSSLEFNGLLSAVTNRAKFPADHVIDLEGKRLRPEALNDASTRILSNGFGYADVCLLAPEAKNQYNQELLAQKRLIHGMEANVIGVDAPDFLATSGKGKFEVDVFLRTTDPNFGAINPTSGAVIKTEGQPPTSPTSVRAPAKPASVANAEVAAGDTTPKLAADDYEYKVTACNSHGESTATAPDAAVTITALGTKRTKLTIAEGGGAYPAESYKVYRKSGDYYYFLFRVAAEAPGTDTVCYDENLWRPNTTMAVVMDSSPDQTLTVLQLLPYFMMPLARIDDSTRFLLKMYLTCMVWNPNRVVIIKNIGSTAWS